MHKNLLQIQYYRLSSKYRKLKHRFEKALKENRFKNYTLHKQRQLIARLEKLRARLASLEQVLKLSGSALALGLVLSTGEVQAQAPIRAGMEFKVNSEDWSYNPSIAMDSDGDFVVTWKGYSYDSDTYEIFAQRYNAAGVAQGSEIMVNTYTTGDQTAPSIAMDSDGDFVITWTSNGQDGDGLGIYAQRYNALGEPQGSELLVNTTTTDNQRNPAIAMDSDGDFVITWESSNQDGDGYGIFAQRYNSLGESQGLEFQVNTYTTNNFQINPAIAMDSDGDFVVTWESYLYDQNTYNFGSSNIYARRYNSLGESQGSEFLVNTYTTDSQKKPSIAMDNDGDFVITWQSYYQDGDSDGIYAQRYNASGEEQGSEFQVNTYTTNRQEKPAIAMDSDGDFVITWQSRGQDGSSWGAFAQRYNASGEAQGGEFQVNTYISNEQENPAIAMNSDGDFVVTWHSYYQDGDYYGIYAQRYTLQSLSLSASSVDENVPANTVIGTLSTTEVNDGDTFTYTLVTGTGDADNASFNIDGDELRITESPDYEVKNSYSIRIRTTDQNDYSFEKVYTITINDVNEAPTDISLSATSVYENVAPNTVVGTLSTTDPDEEDSFTYTLVAGTGDDDNAVFTIVGDELRINHSPDFATQSSYSIRVQTEDQGGLTFEKVFTITVNEVVETSVSKASAGSMVNVYPNPSSGQITINSDRLALEGYHVRIVNLTGETVYASQFREQLDLQQLTKGVYTILLESDKEVIVKQIVIQ